MVESGSGAGSSTLSRGVMVKRGEGGEEANEGAEKRSEVEVVGYWGNTREGGMGCSCWKPKYIDKSRS